MLRFLNRLIGYTPVVPVAAPLVSADSAAARRSQTDRGPFEPVFQQEPGFMTLLDLPRQASPVIQFIADVVGEDPRSRQQVLGLLREPDWRPHLVAAIAALLSNDRAGLSPAIWEAMDRGSWVGPQLGVVLSICDPQFVSGAKRRILAGCPVGAAKFRSSKNLNALVQLVRAIPSESDWVDATSRDPDLQDLIRADRDLGGRFAKHWAAAVRERFAELGLSLQGAPA